jgi:hypothetical protein
MQALFLFAFLGGLAQPGRRAGQILDPVPFAIDDEIVWRHP